MEPQSLSAEMIRILPKGALAHKYNCTVQYVRKVLQGRSSCNSPRAQAIMKDALEIMHILCRSSHPQMPVYPLWHTNKTNLV